MKTNSKLYSLIALFLLMAIGGKAQESNKLYIPDIRIGVGETVLLPVYVQNTSKIITGVQFTFKVEEGISVDVNNATMTNRLPKHKMNVSSKEDLTYTMMIYSSDNTVITGNDGIIVNIPVTVADSVRIGANKAIELSKAVLSDNLGNNVLTEFSAGVIKTAKYPQLTLTAAKQELNEGQKVLFTITNEEIPSAPLSISISSDMPGRLKYPSSVTMEANTSSVTFEVEALDNTEVSDTLTASITASANGYKDGECLLLVIDDDMPEIELELKPNIISEGDGVSSVIGKIIRKTKIENQVTIVLSDDSNGKLYYSNDRIIIPANTREVEFTMGAIDNTAVEEEHSYNVMAAVYIPSCNCSAKETSVGHITKTLTVTDDDGPTLKLYPEQTSVKEGETITFNIVHNVDTDKDIAVSLTSDNDDAFEYDHNVIIPAGQESILVQVKAKENETIEGNRTIVFSVKSEGYTTGTCWIQLTDQTIPDAFITNFTVVPSELEVGQKVTATVTLKNKGFAALPSLTRVNFYISNSKKELGHAYTADTLAVGSEMTLIHEIEMPNITGNYSLRAVVNENRDVKELTYSNNSSQDVAITLLPAFTAIAQANKNVYSTGETVTISGKASGTKASNSDVEIYLINEGNRQIVAAQTDDEGNYSVEYKLPKTASGHFVVGACYPKENLKTEMASFDVYGLRLSACSNNIEFDLGDTYQGTMTITNAVNLKQTGLKVTQGSTPDNCVFAFTIPETVEGSEAITLNYTITPNAVSTGRSWQRMPITISSNEGASTDFSINYYINSRLASLSASVNSINTTMTKGAKRDYPITITNTGRGETGRIVLDIPDWMKTSTPREMASMAQGDSATIVLQLEPTEDMQLNVPIEGKLAINCENGFGIPISFSITPVSESEGKLVIDVVDEFTFETQEAPHVSNAKIEIQHPVTGELIVQGNSGEDGKFTITLPEGQYAVKVIADNHEEYNNQIVVDAGKDNNHEAFVSYDAVSYSWDVVETESEDRYEIETIVKYDTRVPKPVILITLPKERPEEGSIIPIVVTNKGFINAEDVNVSLAISGDYEIEFLSEPYLAKLAANQSEIFYAKITSKSVAGARMKAPSLNECLSLQAKLRAHYICGNKYDNTVTADDLRRWGQCLDYAARYSYGGYGGGGGYAPGGNGGGGYDSGWWQIVPIPVKACKPSNNKPKDDDDNPDENNENPEPDWNNYKYDSEKDPFWTPCKAMGLQAFVDCANNFIASGLSKVFVKSLPLVGCAYGIGTSCVIPMVQKRMTWFGALGCINSFLGCFIPGEELAASLFLSGIVCTGNILDAYLDCNGINLFGDDYIKPNGSRAKKARIVADYNHEDPFDNYMYKLAVAKEETTAFIGYITELFGDESWLYTTPEEIANLINYMRTFSPEEVVSITDELLRYKPSNISTEVFWHFIERCNNTTTGFDSNYQDLDNYIHSDKVIAYCDVIDFCEDYAVSEGFQSSDDMIQDAYSSFVKYLISIKADDETEKSNSVCSTITLSFKQEMVMTRQAFRGTLTVNNGDAANEMKDVKLNLQVKDENGNVATSHEFQISADSIKGFKGQLDLTSGWTLEAKGTGVATILFIPTKYAAPTEPKAWSFGGTFSYVDPTTGLAVTKELNPVTLTVNPSPNLEMNYFMQRDVLGDDALTEDIVEPKVPAEFSLLINNKGYGDATNVKMVTNQPEIIDNEKGLLIDFEILSSQLNGGDKTLAFGQSVATDFGTIPAGGSTYAQWWFTSSLLGHFTEYNVKATHLTSYGNPDLSLLDTVAVHELIHTLTIPESESMRGFLVNDEKDSNDLPDMLYMTDGTVKAVSQASGTLTADGNNIYTLTVEPTAEGWNYGSLIDPTNGHKVLSSITRNSDGAPININNFWQTDRTLRDGKDPLYEYRLHFADKMGAAGETYTLTFEDKPMTILAVDSIKGETDTDAIVTTPLKKATVSFNKEVAASTFTTEDLELTLAGEKLNADEIVISKVDEKQFDLDLTALTQSNGYYVLTVQAAGIKDTEGYFGETGQRLSWVQMKDGLAWLKVRVNPESAGTVSVDSAQVAYGDSIEVVARPNDGYEFSEWIIGKDTVGTDTIYRFVANADVELIANFTAKPFEVNLKYDEPKGWNWISSNLIYDENVDAKKFLEPIKNQVVRLVGFEDELTNDPVYGLVGGLTTLNPVDGYKLYVNESVLFDYSGQSGDPAEYTINLQKGWNWIGYLPVAPLSVDSAFTKLNPVENDVVKSLDAFSTFVDGSWTGTLSEMRPGEGYMYYSGREASFVYPTVYSSVEVSSARRAEPTSSSLIPWSYNAHKYADNSALIGQLYVNHTHSMSDDFIVGAFCDGECRGVGKFIDGRVFMTIHGSLSEAQTIRFVAWNKVDGKQYAIDESIIFDGENVGTIESPMIFHIGGPTKISALKAGFKITPRPLKDKLYISGNTDNIKNVQILSTSGKKVLDTVGYDLSGIDVHTLMSGLYVVVISTYDENVYYEKIFKDKK